MPWSEWPQDLGFRRPILRQFFNILAHPTASKVKDVCINNLQNINDTAFMQSPKVRGVLSGLSTLRLYIVTEDHDPAPELNIEMEELHTFIAELPPLWLAPAAGNLTSLILYQYAFFGYCPKLDLRSVHFSQLRTLALGNYVFSHDWQLDWLKDHASTLENLFLDNCIVVYFSCFGEEDADGYPTELQDQRADNYRFFDLTWSLIFDLLREHHDHLRHFRIGKSAIHDRNVSFGITAHEHMDIDLFPGRYQFFDCTNFTDEDLKELEEGRDIDMGSATEGEKAKAFLVNLSKQTDADLTSLEQLLDKIGQPFIRTDVQE